jgi:hypothetical protein
MDALFGSANASKPVTVNATVPPAAINATGKTLANAVKSAKSVSEALNEVSKQLTEASAALKKNEGPIAETTANVVGANQVAAANAVAPMVGGVRAAMLARMPRSYIVGGTRKAIREAVRMIGGLRNAAVNTAKALNDGVKAANNLAMQVKNNATMTNANKVNNALMSTNTPLNNVAMATNSTVGANVVPPVNVTANNGMAQVNAVKNAAMNVSNAINSNNNSYSNNTNKNNNNNMKMMYGGRRTRKSAKKNSKKNAKKGGFFGMF